MIKHFNFIVKTIGSPESKVIKIPMDAFLPDRITETLDILKTALSLTAFDTYNQDLNLTVETNQAFIMYGGVKFEPIMAILLRLNKKTGIHFAAEEFIQEKLNKTKMRLKRLSVREQQVADNIIQGLTLTSLSKKLKISSETVKMHRKHIYKKLNIHKRDELIEWMNKNNQ